MTWKVVYLPEAENDLKSFDQSQRILILKAINKISTNPLPISKGGYGKPLGKRKNSDLTGLLKVKLKKAGIRIVYKLIYTETEILIVVIGMREDDLVYKIANKRIDNI